MAKVSVKVPATTANIGPGFDCMGCALNIYNILTFEVIDEGIEVTGCLDQKRNENNLAVIAYKKALETMGVEFSGVRMSMDANIPGSRGLGSSAAIIVGAVMAASHLFGNKLSVEEIFKISTEIEGHPDNIAPALFGGLTASFMEGETPHCVRYDIADKWRFVAIVPEFRLPTNKSRAALPKNVRFKDAVFNVSRTAVLLKAFENGDSKLLSLSLADKLHQQYRKTFIKEYDTVERAARRAGVMGFYLSGAGPTLMCIADSDDTLPRLKSYILAECRQPWRVLPLGIDFNGAKVVE